MRISVIGLPGSGKTTLANTIAQKLSIPHIHLDRFWFEAGGRNGAHDTPNIEAARAHVNKNALEAIAADSWVSDGFYSRLQPVIANRADIVIYLNMSLPVRLFNHTKRTFRRNNRHKEVSFLDDLKFFPEIISRTFRTGPKLKKFIEESGNKVLVLKSRREIRRYLDNLK